MSLVTIRGGGQRDSLCLCGCLPVRHASITMCGLV